MPKNLTITDVNVQQEYRIRRDAGTGKIFADVGFEYVLTGGLSLTGSRSVELTGTAKTRAVALFQDIKDAVFTAEGL